MVLTAIAKTIYFHFWHCYSFFPKRPSNQACFVPPPLRTPHPHPLFLFLIVLSTECRVRCLNESAPGSALNCLKPWDKRRDPEPFLESEEDDPELIIFVPFTQVNHGNRSSNALYCVLRPSSSIVCNTSSLTQACSIECGRSHSTSVLN